MSEKTKEQLMEELYLSLDRRYLPQDVAEICLKLLDSRLESGEKRLLRRARSRHRSCMRNDFRRPKAIDFEPAEYFFSARAPSTKDNPKSIDKYIDQANKEINRKRGQSSFRNDRLNKEARKDNGLGDLSKRRYNKMFRLLARMEKKSRKLEMEAQKRDYSIMAKSGLSFKIKREDFFPDLNTACFLAYYTARCNTRSVFTVCSQERPYDEIADMLFKRVVRGRRGRWFAIAHVMPNEKVIGRLTDLQKTKLLSTWFESLKDLAGFMGSVWEKNDFNIETMIVKRGNDSSTWNSLAGAWNKARDGWINLLYCMGLEDVLRVCCPGKVMRLIAGDVAAWHVNTGDDWKDDNTKVWAELPFPWAVLSGKDDCTKAMVESVCRRHGVPPDKSGWVGPKPGEKVHKFRPSPELVHGVVVDSPMLARTLRKAGVFSGKVTKGEVDYFEVDKARNSYYNNVMVEKGEEQGQNIGR